MKANILFSLLCLNFLIKLSLTTNLITQKTYKRILLDKSYWPGLVYKTVALKVSNQLECNSHCLADSTNCNVAVYNGTCWLAQLAINNLIIPSPQQNLYSFVDFDLLRNQMSTMFVPVQSSLTNSTWTNNCFFITTIHNTDSLYDCLNQCSNVYKGNCDYFVMDSSDNCYSCNRVKMNNRATTLISVTLYVMYDSVFYAVGALGNSYTYFIAQTYPSSSTSFNQCAQYCMFNGNCHFFIYAPTSCLIGNFKGKPTLSGYTGTNTAYIFMDFVRTDNVPDGNYFNTTISPTTWGPKILDNYNNVASEGLCSSICTLLYPRCELYVWFPIPDQVCLTGQLALSSTASYSGPNIMRTRKLYQVFTIRSSGRFQLYCPTGWNLMSCGNSQSAGFEKYRAVYPISSTGCECYDGFGVNCEAWCTTLPLKSFSIATQGGNQFFTVSCPAGTVVIGCHYYTYTGNSYEAYRRSYPISSQTCQCYDYFGLACYASCASNIINYEIVSTYSSGFVAVSCNNPNNIVLGCGFSPSGAEEGYKITHVTSNTTCTCYNYYGTNCYAICGQIQP